MSRLRLATATVAVLALLTPGVFAADAVGELSSGSISLPNGAQAQSAGMSLLWQGQEVPSIDLELTDLALQRIVFTTIAGVDREDSSERFDASSAKVTLAPGASFDVVSLRAEGASVATFGSAQIRGVAAVLLADVFDATPESCARWENANLPCIDEFGVYELDAAAVSGTLGGAITLLVHGPTLRVVASGETKEFTSGLAVEQGAGPASVTQDAWVYVKATIVSATFASETVKAYATVPTIRAPSVAFADAAGALRVGSASYSAAGDDVAAAGALILAPGPVVSADAHGDGGEPIYADSIKTRVSGDVASINLNAASAFLDSPAEKAGAAAILALVIAGIAYSWNHLAFAFAALYTRLNKPDILDNDVRNRIYDIIRENPGISAREVHRRSEQSWGTVVYHLRQLERHHLVVSRSLGRTRNYYENHGKYRGMEVQLACLQSDRARVLARAIAGQPGITQEQLAVASGFPQPTTSYYVRKLKQAGLVEEQREGRYARYVPHADLPRFIAMSDASVTNGPATTGVQA